MTPEETQNRLEILCKNLSENAEASIVGHALLIVQTRTHVMVDDRLIHIRDGEYESVNLFSDYDDKIECILVGLSDYFEKSNN